MSKRLLIWTGLSLAVLMGGYALRPAQAVAQDTSEGATLYRRHCAACHQASGDGVPGMFPRIRDRVGGMAEDPEVRAYLLSVMVHGLTGPIEVDGRKYSGFMPSFGSLSDSEIADILNSLGASKTKSIDPSEIAQVRDTAMTAQQVGAIAPHKVGS